MVSFREVIRKREVVSSPKWCNTVRMGTTNYFGTFIEVADDCPLDSAQQPPVKNTAPTVANLQYDLISDHPYELTSDDVLFAVHAIRKDIPEQERDDARTAFFAKSQACLRSSPLGKRYGWGIHYNAEGRIALVPLGSGEYQALADDPTLRHLKAMRSKRA